MNNKGKFRDELPKENKFKSFFKESGFYIAIVVGLCALAAGAVYFSTNQILSDPNPSLTRFRRTNLRMILNGIYRSMTISLTMNGIKAL